MGYDSGKYYGPNRSELFRQLKEHFRRRGVTSERKLEELVWRWIRRKGYRPPILA